MTCECICHEKDMPFCVMCEKKHPKELSAGYLIDQKLQGFFMDKDKNGNIKQLLFIYEKSDLTISWDHEKNTFKFTMASR